MSDASTAQCPPKAVIPVIFVPGIMGSRLKNPRNVIIWDPPTTGQPYEATRATDPSIPKDELRPAPPHYGPGPGQTQESATRWQMYRDAQDEVQGVIAGAKEWFPLGGPQRRERFIGFNGEPFNESFLSVDRGNKEKFVNRLGPDIIDMALERGWGGCVWEYYGGFLRWLHYTASMDICAGATVKLEVWAHPYNWTDDNKNSGRKLADVVNRAYSEAQSKYADDPEYPVLKPVVITHSMGGMVARAYAKHFGGENVCHAMIHGAMPTHGAPATYKRMRAGFEGLSSIVLGWNGAEVTAILGNAPGGLELLPSHLHQNADGARQWLYPRSQFYMSGDGLNTGHLPSGDPYNEIYRNQRDWWRLLNAEWVNPGINNGYALYSIQLDKAQAFHADLGSYFHPNTRMFYSDDYNSWDRVEIKNYVQESELHIVDPDGAMVYNFGDEEISPASAPGDGTVHIGSAKYIPATVECIFSDTKTGADFRFTHEAPFSKREVQHQIAFWLHEIVREQMT